jgi:acetyl esterase/lipase
MPSLGTRAFAALYQLLRVSRALSTEEAAKAILDGLALRPAPYGPPKRLGAEVRVSLVSSHPWPVYEISPSAGACHGVTIYIHGGAWALEIQPAQWRLVAEFASKAQTRVLVPIYPLLPRGSATEAVDTVAALTRDAVATEGPGRVNILGDSAGGQIALSAALQLRDLGIALRRTVLIAPAVDLAFDNPEIAVVERSDPLLRAAGTRYLAELWRGSLGIRDPRVSPLHGELTGIGPLTVFSGTRDITSPDTRLLVEKARASGVEVHYEPGPGLVHTTAVLPTRDGRRIRRAIVRTLQVAEDEAP